MWHVDEGELHAYLDGELEVVAGGRAVDIEAHLAVCAECGARLERARRYRNASRALLSVVGAEPGDPPPFEDLLRRARRDPPSARPRLSSRSRRGLAWAASIALAIGAGWFARAAMGPRSVESASAVEHEDARSFAAGSDVRPRTAASNVPAVDSKDGVARPTTRRSFAAAPGGAADDGAAAESTETVGAADAVELAAAPTTAGGGGAGGATAARSAETLQAMPPAVAGGDGVRAAVASRASGDAGAADPGATGATPVVEAPRPRVAVSIDARRAALRPDPIPVPRASAAAARNTSANALAAAVAERRTAGVSPRPDGGLPVLGEPIDVRRPGRDPLDRGAPPLPAAQADDRSSLAEVVSTAVVSVTDALVERRAASREEVERPRAPARTVRGRVVEEGNGAALVGTRVLLIGSDGEPVRSTRADLKGGFEFRNVAPGRYHVAAARSGYDGTPRRIVVEDRSDVVVVELVMRPVRPERDG